MKSKKSLVVEKVNKMLVSNVTMPILLVINEYNNDKEIINEELYKLLCQKNNHIINNNACKICEQIKLNKYTNCNWIVQNQWESIKKQDFLNVINQLDYSNFLLSEPRVVVIEQVEYCSKEVLNLLIILLKNPKPETLVILTTRNIHAVSNNLKDLTRVIHCQKKNFIVISNKWNNFLTQLNEKTNSFVSDAEAITIKNIIVKFFDYFLNKRTNYLLLLANDIVSLSDNIFVFFKVMLLLLETKANYKKTANNQITEFLELQTKVNLISNNQVFFLIGLISEIISKINNKNNILLLINYFIIICEREINSD